MITCSIIVDEKLLHLFHDGVYCGYVWDAGVDGPKIVLFTHYQNQNLIEDTVSVTFNEFEMIQDNWNQLQDMLRERLAR